MSHAVAVVQPVEVSERIEEIAALVHSGEVRAAVHLTRKVLDAADTATFELIAECARVIEHTPERAIPRMRVLWRKHRSDEHRAIIAAFAPKQGEAPRHRTPAPVRQPDWTAARDERTRRVDPRSLPERRSARDAETRRARYNVAADYAETRAGVEETAPTYLHPRTAFDALSTAEPAPGYGIDYDRAALYALRGLPCLVCWMERAAADHRHPSSDDNLCGTCRERGRPGLVYSTPPANRVQVLIARCAYIVARCSPVAALAILKQEWRRALDPTARAAIAAWVETHFTVPATGEPADHAADTQQRSAPDAAAPLTPACLACRRHRTAYKRQCADCGEPATGHECADCGGHVARVRVCGHCHVAAPSDEPTDPAPAAALPAAA
jgi:hypothetical protein